MFERISRIAIASTIAGCLIIIPIFSAVAAIVFGILALYKIAEHKKKVRGKGFAITGIALGVGQLVCLVVIVFVWFGQVLLSYVGYYSGYHAKASLFKARGNYKKAVECYNKALEHIPQKNGYNPHGDEFIIYHDMGVALQLMGDYGEAFKAYSKALEIAFKQEAAAHYGMGYIYMDWKKFNKALQEFDKAIKLNPDNYDAYQNKAVTFRRMGRFKDSVLACKKTISLFPDFAKAYCSLGWAYEKLGRYKDAIKAHLEAIQRAPDWKFPKRRLELCLSKLDNKKLTPSLLKEIEQLDPSLIRDFENKPD